MNKRQGCIYTKFGYNVVTFAIFHNTLHFQIAWSQRIICQIKMNWCNVKINSTAIIIEKANFHFSFFCCIININELFFACWFFVCKTSNIFLVLAFLYELFWWWIFSWKFSPTMFKILIMFLFSANKSFPLSFQQLFNSFNIQQIILILKSTKLFSNNFSSCFFYSHDKVINIIFKCWL